MPSVHLLDHVAGNIRSLVNAIEKLGFTVEWIKSPEDVLQAEVSQIHRVAFPTKNHIFTLSIETHRPRRRPFRALPQPDLTGRIL